MIIQKIKNKFFSFLEKHDRKRIIMDRQCNEPLLTRYYLFLKDRKRFPFNMFLHKFHKGDPGDVHDHPWPYATLILKGGYYECEGVTPWTLFMPGPHKREWGFLVDNKWIHNDQYLEDLKHNN